MKKIFITALSVLMLSLIGCGKTGSPKEIETESIPAELETKTVAKTEKETESQKDIEKYELNKVEEFTDDIAKQKYTFTFKDYYLDNEGYPYEEYIDDLQDVNNTFFICEYTYYCEPLYEYKKEYSLYDMWFISDYFKNNDNVNVTLNIDGTEIRCNALYLSDDGIITSPFPDKQAELFRDYNFVIYTEVDKEMIEQAQSVTLTHKKWKNILYTLKIK
jgi:hypothetical protein